jgi:hypothetical protein
MGPKAAPPAGPAAQQLNVQYTTSSGGTGVLYGQSLQLQVATILHELAHNLNLINPDSNGRDNQSMLNTGTIMSNCGAGISAVR